MDHTSAILISASTSAVVTLAVSVMAVRYSVSTNQRNRGVMAALQLAKDFYQDQEFLTNRLSCWEALRAIPPELCDYEKLVTLGPKGEIPNVTPEQVCTLNRIAAFYNTLKGLVEKGEVDVPLLQELFTYNYNRFWNPIREKIADNTAHELEKSLFRDVPELESSKWRQVIENGRRD